MPGAETTPVLYSFRRCPYAIRARMAIAYARVPVALREVVLKNKPPSLLEASAKGTVPVLVLADGTVIDESLDIMHWALAQRDPHDWLLQAQPHRQPELRQLIALNDGPFKQALDRYKYADRHPQHPAESYRRKCEALLAGLEDRLRASRYLLGPRPSLADIALFPFVRQFSGVDSRWFEQAPYPCLQQWLQGFLDTALFAAVMHKYPAWQTPADDVGFPPQPV